MTFVLSLSLSLSPLLRTLPPCMSPIPHASSMQTVLSFSLLLSPFFFSSASSRACPLPFCNSPTRPPHRTPPLLVELLCRHSVVRLRPIVVHRTATRLRLAAAASSSLLFAQSASSSRVCCNLALLNSPPSPARRLLLLPLVATASPNRAIRRRASPSADYLPSILSVHELVVASTKARRYLAVDRLAQLRRPPPIVPPATTIA